MNDWVNNIRGILSDLDGVHYIGHQRIDGSVETIGYLKALGMKMRFLTNTSGQSLDQLFEHIHQLKLPILKEEIISTPHVAMHYLQNKGINGIYPILQDNVREMFEEHFALTDNLPEAVVIGDIDKGWTYDLMNKIFNLVMQGAEIIALHKGKYWKTPYGNRLDIGAFIKGIEYATNKEATVIGKPSETYFNTAIQSINLDKNQLFMVGDDIDSDIGGAQNIGIKGVLVRTGKYREEAVRDSNIRPDLVIDKFASLLKLF